MIYINLLPWRENKLKRKCRNFLVQTIGLLSLTVLISGFLWAKNTSQIKNQLANLTMIETENHTLFSRIESFQSARQLHLKQQKAVKRINQLIGNRQIIPQLLALVQHKKISFQVSYLSIDQKNIRIIGTDNSTESALSMLNTLREESLFCQVTFTPLQTKRTPGVFEFELKAQICDENSDQ